MKEVALNYAQALYSLAKEEKSIKEWGEQGQLVIELFSDNSDLLLLLDSRFLTIAERKNHAEMIFKNFATSIIDFIKVIIDYHRLPIIVDIFQAFISLCYEAQGILQGRLYSAFDLEKGVIQLVEETISRLQKRKVALKLRLDPTLIGGVKVVINGHVYDDTIKNQLEKMELSLLTKESEYEN